MKGNILILGGAGFLGRALLKKAFRENWDANFTVYSRDELKQDLCKRKFPNVNYVLGDIRDIDRLSTHAGYADIIINAAALKYVPESEFNVGECLDINTGGTKSVIIAARQSRRAHTVVGISTDKAVMPVNTYGISKAAGERLYQEAAQLYKHVKFVQTRYGNVVGSTGSVVPVFKRMADEYGFVTITDPEMTRFWHSHEEAVCMIEHAVECASGDTIIPDPHSMRLDELVQAILPDVPVQIIGARPGEKRHETLLTYAESAHAVRDHGEYYRFNRTLEPHNNLFEITSDVAQRMTAEAFRTLCVIAEEI